MKNDNPLDLSLWPTPDLEQGQPGTRKNANPRCFLLVRALFHQDIAEMLQRSCCQTLLDFGVESKQITSIAVPGAFELAPAIAAYSQRKSGPRIAAAIAMGCVIKGETRHFDYVCSGTVNALGQLNAAGNFPVILGVLTTSNYEEAERRASPDAMNKGKDFALSALWMANLAPGSLG